MSVNLFFVPNIDTDTIILPEEEARHCRVLRYKLSDVIDITDGEGFFYKGRIESIGKREVLVSLIEKREQAPDRDYFLYMAVATTKNIGFIVGVRWGKGTVTLNDGTKFDISFKGGSPAPYLGRPRDRIRPPRTKDLSPANLQGRPPVAPGHVPAC